MPSEVWGANITSRAEAEARSLLHLPWDGEAPSSPRAYRQALRPKRQCKLIICTSLSFPLVRRDVTHIFLTVSRFASHVNYVPS